MDGREEVRFRSDVTVELVQQGKPGAYEFTDGTPAQHKLVDEAVRKSCRAAYAAYLEMLDAGVAREVARTVLPVGIYSSMYATCNARALMNFFSCGGGVRPRRFPRSLAGDRDGRRADGGRVGAPDAAHPRRLRAQRARLPVGPSRRMCPAAGRWGLALALEWVSAYDIQHR